MEHSERNLPSVMALAYLGDAVYSLYVRDKLVRMGYSHAGDLNALSLSYVTAPKQAALVKSLLPFFTEWERDIYRRAYNHKGLRAPAHATRLQYQAATGFEAVLGALHYTGDEERIAFLLQTAEKNSNKNAN